MYSTNMDEIDELFNGDLCLILNSCKRSLKLRN